MTVPLLSERRRLSHCRMRLPVRLVDVDTTSSDLAVYPGHTVDVGVDSALVETDVALPPACSPTLKVRLPDGTDLVALVCIAAGARVGDRFQYRLVFVGLGDDDRARLSHLLLSRLG